MPSPVLRLAKIIDSGDITNRMREVVDTDSILVAPTVSSRLKMPLSMLHVLEDRSTQPRILHFLFISRDLCTDDLVNF
jgi:hypothetical protein